MVLLNSEKIIRKLFYWSKIKKDPTHTNGYPYIKITGEEYDFLDNLITYAFNQTNLLTCDENATFEVYKAIIPISINIAKVEYNNTQLTLCKKLTEFFCIHKDVLYYPEIEYGDLAYIDTETNIIYTRKNYEGKITVTDTNGKQYFYSLQKHHIWNFFDEFGYLFCCKRIESESNNNYRNRILDTFINYANSTKLGLLNGIARELDLRKTLIWEDGGEDFEILDSAVTLNSISVDEVMVNIENIYITDKNTIVLKGDKTYTNIKRKISYVCGIEMHKLYNKNDEKLKYQLYRIDGSATDKLREYKENINKAIPIKWNYFAYDKCRWNTSFKNISSQGCIPTMYDAKTDGFK